MKVLIISQPVLSRSNNMGKTLMGYFSSFSASDVSQLFLRKGTPTNKEICENYYCFSDSDALKSILNHKIQGTIFNKVSINDAIETVKQNDAYKLGAAHKAWMLLARDLVWKLSNWKNPKLLSWLRAIHPDIIFFASGDGAFSYRVADEIARYLHKPLVMVCMDDFFINNRNKGEMLGKIRQKFFMNTVNRTVQDCTFIFTICDKMNEAYNSLFKKKCFTLHTSADNQEMTRNPQARHISYIGNLNCGRNKTLLDLGKAISEIGSDKLPKVIDVYSGTRETKYTDSLKNALGIRFHGAIPAEQVPEVMCDSIMVIHTESFDPAMMERVRFSVSTKIAESLMYGPCLLAYGPEGVASIDYLKENKAAFVISEPDKLKKELKKILSNGHLQNQILKNARALAARNHSSELNSQKIRLCLEQAIDAQNCCL